LPQSVPGSSQESAVTVSVIIPAYNAASYISATLDSVFSQEFTDYELILINDGSPDTPELEQALRPYRDRIVYLPQANRGVSHARNVGIRYARGEYVAFLDSDDLWLPRYLGEQMRRLAAAPSIDLIYSNGTIFGDSPLAGRTLMEASPSNGAVTFERLIDERCTVLLSCTVARRRALLDAGGFDERFRRSEDFHLWLRLAFAGRNLAYHRQPLVRHRRSHGSLSHDRVAMIEAMIAVLRDIDQRLPLTEQQRARVRRQIARRQAQMALEQGKRLFISEEYEAAAEALARSWRSDPSRWRRARLRAIHFGLRATPRLARRLFDLRRHLTAPAATSRV
jgi:glycosyltransferase involved in cell wall biosynthesis